MSNSPLSKQAPNSVLDKRAYDLINEVNSEISSMSSRTESSGPKTPIFWLPPVISLLNPDKPIEPIPALTKSPPITNKKRKLNPPVFMPMIPYYFHHKEFGIESCMLQLEGQKKFSKYYYI